MVTDFFNKDVKGVIETLLYDPLISKIVSLFIALIIVWSFIKFLKRFTASKITDNEQRYQVRKFVELLGFILFGIAIFFIFNDHMGQWSVALGVFGAGIAFAMQEIILSVAGWVSITFTRIFNPGDRIKLNNIVGDVIDIGVLHDTDGMRRLGKRRFVQRPYCPYCQQ